MFALVIAFSALGATYSFANPIFEAPDELWHYAYIREIATQRGFPVMLAGGAQPWAQEGTQAPLYYLLGAPLIAGIDARELEALPAPNPFARLGEPQAGTNDNRNLYWHTPDEAFPFRGTALAAHLLRLYSVALGALTVALTFALAREILPARVGAAIAAAGFVALLPQFIFIGSSINNDNLATTLATAMLWQLARALREGITPRRVVILGLIAGGALLTKFNTVTLIPLALLAFVLIAAPRRAWRTLLGASGAFVAIVALIAGWWYARSFALYGDPSGLALIINLIGERPVPIHLARWFLGESEGLVRSTWGVFGWMNVLADPRWYWLFDLLALLGVAGIIGAGLSRRRDFAPANFSAAWRRVLRPDLLGLALLAIWCAVTYAGVVRYNLALPAAQGRLLFPALGAGATLWAWGVTTILPARIQTGAIVLLLATQATAASIVPMLFIAPAYTPTRVSADAIPARAARVNARFANGAEILAVDVPRTTVQPGDAFDLTIYTRVADAPAARAAVFAHVVNSAEVIVAQRDSALASGNWGALTFPTILADSFRVQIPLTAPAPDAWQIVIGMADLESRGRLGEPLSVARLTAQANDAAWRLDFDGKAILDRAQIAPFAVAPGGTLAIRSTWRDIQPGWRVFAHALGDADRIWASADEPLARDLEFALTFAPDTPPGVYPVELGVYPINGDRVAVYDARQQLLGDRIFLGPVRVVR